MGEKMNKKQGFWLGISTIGLSAIIFLAPLSEVESILLFKGYLVGLGQLLMYIWYSKSSPRS